MVSIGTLFSDLMQLVGLNHYTKTQSDNQYAAKDHSHTGYLTSHQDISGKLDKAQGSSKASKNVVTDSNGNITTEAKPTIPSASSTTPSADTTNGSVGSGTTWAKADHTHPKSTLYAEASHTHSNYVNPTIVDNLTTNDSTKVLSAKQGKVLQDNKLEKTHASYKGKNVVTNASTGAIEFEDKPTIPSKTSDLTNDSGFLTSHQDISGKSDVGHTHTKSEITDFPSTITPSSHAHGNITNDGKVGTASGKPLITTTGGAVTTGSFGSSSGTFCQGNDSRLSNARTPTSHTHGNLTNDGKVGTASGKIITTTTGGAITASDSITKSMISDFPTTMTPSSHTHGTGDVSDTSAYTNIGSSANATQKTINDKINTALGNKANSSNVYTKSETYTQSEITTLIANAVAELQLFEVVKSLPTTNIKTNRLYLIVNGENIANNSYDIYLRVNDSWESLDALEFDISNFYTKTETDTLLNGKVDTSDSRLTDSRTPKSHTHGNITNTGAVGSTANKPLITTTNGVVTTGSFGTSANTFCQGNDSRLSDARTPTSHSHGSLANGGTLNSDITSVNKIAVTDSSNNLKTISQLPYSKISGTPTIPSKTSDLTNDSGFLTSHQDISGKIDTAGSGLSKSGTTLNHSNSITAITTAAFKKIKYDAQGHITGTDNVTESDLPSHGHSLDDVQLYDPITGCPVVSYDGSGYIYVLNDSIYVNTDEDGIPYLTSNNSPVASLADISGKIDTAGTGLSKSGTTLNHSNSITAVTTAAFKKIKYDAQGHITGTADVAASDLPSHTHSQYALSTDIPSSTSDLTNDGEDGINPFVSDDDSRLSNARTPTSHTHGNLTNDGKVGSTANYFVYTTTGGAITSKQKIGNITTSGAIGSTANKPLITTTSGVITTGSFGTAANTFCAGNDSRLHTHTFTYSNGTLTIS